MYNVLAKFKGYRSWCSVINATLKFNISTWPEALVEIAVVNKTNGTYRLFAILPL